MKFMNDFEIRRAVPMYAGHAVLGPATQTIANLQEWANQNSDGWHIWPAPVRAARGVIELVVRDGTSTYYGGPRPDATADEYKRALRAVKAFRTKAVKRGMPTFDIIEPHA